MNLELMETSNGRSFGVEAIVIDGMPLTLELFFRVGSLEWGT